MAALIAVVIMGKYQEVIQFLYDQLPMYQRSGAVAIKKDLSNIRYLCHFLGHPQHRMKCIHVAGTNGKGSVSHMIAACLQSSGRRIGLYTSPHYRDFRERIKINGKLIAEQYVIDFVERIKPAIEKCKPSFFEITVAMAFDYFVKEQVDIAVIETGLGGRLDSTNLVVPLLSVITNISYDHQDMLGPTLSHIATEKAGIIKVGVPVVVGEHEKEADLVFRNIARDRESPLYFAEDLIQFDKPTNDLTGMILPIAQNQTNLDLDRIQLELATEYQINNCRTALVALAILKDLQVATIDERHILEGLKSIRNLTSMIGRWQLLQSHPDVIVDSAHNEAGIKRVMEELRNKAYPVLHLVIGFVKGKQIENLIHLMPRNAIYYVTAPKLPRAFDAEEVLQILKNTGRQGKVFESVSAAVKEAKRQASKDDGIFVGGSSYVVAEAI